MRTNRLALLVLATAACSKHGDSMLGDDIALDDAAVLDGAEGDGAQGDGAQSDGTPADAALGECAHGASPGPELCDGELDEDCDGTIDEDCPTDPFEAASCGGPPMTATQALALLGGAARRELATATIEVHERTCTNGTCGPWGPSASWITHFLTWSGGASTRYKDLQADTRLVLFADEGVPKLSMQHVTFTQGGFPDSDGFVVGLPPGPPQMYPYFRAYNVNPQTQYDYRELLWQFRTATIELGTRCARFTSQEFGMVESERRQFAALYRW